MSRKGLTAEEIAELFGLKWIESKGTYEADHGRTVEYNDSGWAIDGTVIVGSYYNNPEVLFGMDATYRLFPLLAEKVKRLEEELNEYRYGVK